ncbi:hypothetical protein B296_00050950 [Ensete ventricosum]|uniref:Uncharacterized protein n=1 Tax=Ensete ventricosum TaxID=4639 RepID=A0A426WWG8_ENSVE|nr:hypothetical protein B296_00050950 [Ensete ventricosum]
MNSGTSPGDLAERVNSGTIPGDFAERVNLGTNPRDLAENVNSSISPRDLAERVKSCTNPGDLAENVNSGTSPGDLAERLRPHLFILPLFHFSLGSPLATQRPLEAPKASSKKLKRHPWKLRRPHPRGRSMHRLSRPMIRLGGTRR